MPDRERVLALLHELARADSQVGALLDELDGLARETDAVRVRALELQDFGARLPAWRGRASAELARAKAEESAARDALDKAEEAVRAATKESEPVALRFETRARDRFSVAERRRAEAEAAVEELGRKAVSAREEERELEERARLLAGTLRGRPRLAEDAGAAPGQGLAGIADWGETARAALFVARGQVATERDAIVRQSNELGALALGEPLTALGATAITRRVEKGFGEDGQQS